MLKPGFRCARNQVVRTQTGWLAVWAGVPAGGVVVTADATPGGNVVGTMTHSSLTVPRSTTSTDPEPMVHTVGGGPSTGLSARPVSVLVAGLNVAIGGWARFGCISSSTHWRPGGFNVPGG